MSRTATVAPEYREVYAAAVRGHVAAQASVRDSGAGAYSWGMLRKALEGGRGDEARQIATRQAARAAFTHGRAVKAQWDRIVELLPA